MKDVYIAYSASDKGYPSLTFEAKTQPLPIDKIAINEGIFPIAETSTLPDGYYDNNQLDTRYPSDKRRAEIIDMAANDDKVPARVVRILGSVAAETLEPWERAVSPEDLSDQYEKIYGAEDFLVLTTFFLKTSSELSDFVYEEPSYTLSVIEELGHIEMIHKVSNIDDVITYIRDTTKGLRGRQRIERLRDVKADIERMLAVQKNEEDVIIRSGTEAGLKMQHARIERERYVADAIDATLFRLGTNSGTIVDPAYLLDSTYYRLLDDEPDVSFDYKTDFLRHMMGGHWALGQDHTFVYRNTGEGMATAQTGVVPDYAAIRPGNFLYHDLKLLEHGPFKQGFPTRTLFAYIRNHYLRKMDLTVLDEDGQADDEKNTFNLFFMQDDKRHIVPLEKTPDHVIPFRALKKNEESHYYEYGEECYMAELVDIALQLDMIDKKCGTEELVPIADTVNIGAHAIDLLNDLYYSGKERCSTTALAVVQILFMEGKIAVGGRHAIEEALGRDDLEGGWMSKLNTITCIDELRRDGTAQVPRPPLTCYYEWFQKYAHPVTSSEMKRRGLSEVGTVFI